MTDVEMKVEGENEVKQDDTKVGTESTVKEEDNKEEADVEKKTEGETEEVKQEDTTTTNVATDAESKGKEEDKKDDDDGGGGPEEDDKKTTLEAIVGRLKFFFSAANIRQDKFLRKFLMSPSEENPTTGYVPIEALLRFNTIKSHTTDATVIVEAAKSLPDLLVLDEDEKSVGRVKPFTESMRDDNIPVSLMVQNLPFGGSSGEGDKQRVKYTCTVNEVQDLFEVYGKVALVKLRYKNAFEGGRGPNKNRSRPGGFPSGSALVEFESVESLQKAAEEVLTTKDHQTIEPKRELVLGERVLKVKLFEEWLNDLRAELEANGGGKNNGGRKESSGEDNNNNNKAFTFDWKPGCVLKLQGLPKDCDREALLESVGTALELDVAKVKELKIFVDYYRGRPDGMIRFNEPSEHVETLKAKLLSGETEVKGSKVESVSLLEGEEEKKYWDDYIDFKNNNNRKRSLDDEDKKKTFAFDWKPGCVIKLKGLPEDCDREALLDAVAESLELTVPKVKDMKIYADYSRGQTDGALRFREPSEHVGRLKEKLSSGETLVKGSKVESVFLLEGEDEKKYWDNFIDFKNKQMQHRAEERGHHNNNNRRRKKFRR